MPEIISDDLSSLLTALPPRVNEAVTRLGNRADLLEIVLDLGRLPAGRFPEGEVILSQEVVTRDDLAYVIGHIGQFGDDNRAGVERTLHRISAIRNRRGEVVGLTCRVGRAVRGAITLIRDVVEQGKSILILGRPGAGKTTLLREAARVLAGELSKRVVVVDTSNEIAGDGDIPHPGIGRARRMQVRRTAEQHAVMIEAVENHMPEVIVIDEIGTELEALAARTIAERGVQLVGTAHGRTLDNLLLNPTLSDLVGGIQTVTLGDEEARRRGTQKSVLERKAPPTFDVLVEQEERNLVGVHLDLAGAVDMLLRNEAPQREMRERLDDGTIRRWKESAQRMARPDGVGLPSREAPTNRVETAPRRGRSALAGSRAGTAWWDNHTAPAPAEGPRTAPRWLDPELARSAEAAAERAERLERAERAVRPAESAEPGGRKRHIYPLGVSRARLEQVIRELNLPAVVSRDERDADVLLTIKSMYRKQPDRVDAAQAGGLPVWVLRSGGMDRLRETLAEIFHVERRLPLTTAVDADESVEDESED